MSFTRPLDHVETAALEKEGKTVPPDWADSLTRINRAARKLEDALPGAKQAEVVAALTELEAATQDLKQFLTFRSVLSIH